jgi:alginate O-acetyltransferase complex protein AlgI
MSEGLERILIGLSQKLIVSDLFLSAFLPPESALNEGLKALQHPQLLFACVVKFLKLYFDFAGYTSISIGVGLLFGIRLMENFNFPLLRPTLAEFWRNWHISLSSWARDYVYFPVLMKYRTPSLALICTMLVIGMWHSIQPGWVLWGLHHGVGLSLLSLYQKRTAGSALLCRLRSSKMWWLLSTLCVWWYVSLGFLLTFRPETLSSSLLPYLRVITFGSL